jgi:phosphoglycolate phosphatase
VSGPGPVDDAIDWSRVDLVVFDLDGTLYDARRLRAVMALWLLADALRHRSLATVRALAAFRRVREALGDASARRGVDFEALQDRLAARRAGCTPTVLRQTVQDWMEQRPLRWLRPCRRPGVAEVFEGLRRAGKPVAVWSDYPAQAKLQALGLRADLVVSASDAQVRRLKPDPVGLQFVLRHFGVAPGRALMVGDRVDRDVAAAARAGVPALWLGGPGRALFRRQSGRPGLPAGTRRCAGFHDPRFAPLRPARRWGGLALRYTVTGGLAAAVDLGLFQLLAPRWSAAAMPGGLPGVLVAALASFLVAAAVNFVASSCWAYRQDWRSPARALRFLLAAGLGACVNGGITTALALAGWPALAAKAVGIGLAFGLNFAVNTAWVFSPPRGGACAGGPSAAGRTRHRAIAAAAWRRHPSARE